MNQLLRIFVALFALIVGAGRVEAQAHDHAHAQRTGPWPAEVIATAERLPIQDGGRVKPLNTYAGFLLLRLNGKRSLTTPGGEKLKPVEWLMDVLFFPDQAADYPMFMVADIQAIEAIGLTLDGKKKRDRYSLNELQPGLGKLFALAREYMKIEEKMRSTLQAQIVTLAHNVDEYSSVAGHADFARHPIAVGEGEKLARAFEGRSTVSVSALVAKGEDLARLDAELNRDPTRDSERAAFNEMLRNLDALLGDTWSMALYPPNRTEPKDSAWLSPSDVVSRSFSTQEGAPTQLEMLADFESATRAADDMAAFAPAFERFASKSIALATARGEYEKVPLEVSYYKADLLTNGLAFFLLAFVLCAAMWMAPRVKWLYGAAGLSTVLGVGLLIGAIVMRCIIRDRPPVSTLYETLLFVTAVGASAALVMEWINRQRIALSATVVLGIVGLFLANGYETLDKKDTMPQLVAVLDTNFWLATHVTAITIGYSAGMLAALLANAYLIAGFFTKGATTPFRKSISRMTYGALGFGLIFSVVGTILGGIWANESWGRFWGWDPKENGALLICLAQLVILHGRAGGYLRDFGIAMATGFQGSVIAFSWFGVNLLGVGLHSYGFTSGIHTALWSYYIAQWGLIAIAGVHHYLIARAAAPVQSKPDAKASQGKAPLGKLQGEGA